MMEFLSNRSVLQLLGQDSAKFLQGMTTNNIVKNTYSYNYLLSNQGRYLFDFFVYQQSEDCYFLDIHIDDLLSLSKRLKMYKLRSSLEIKDVSEEYKIIYSDSLIDSEVEYSFKDPRYKELGYRSMLDSSKIQDLGLKASDLYMSDKYKYAIVDGNDDLINDRSIPIEYGAEELNAIDYQKGCYVGQEVISRAKYQGVVRKKIFKLQSDSSLESIEKGGAVTDLEGNKIGVICSVYENLAIALLREEKFLELKEKIARIEGQVVDIIIPLWRAL
ncbi:MAG: folate-binding protein [Rickettsiaceae bacterium]|nr:folate-binding protein [Rickettsiaceae bacterium]